MTHPVLAAARDLALRLTVAGSAILFGVSLIFAVRGRWPGYIAAGMWLTIGVLAFRAIWNDTRRTP